MRFEDFQTAQFLSVIQKVLKAQTWFLGPEQEYDEFQEHTEKILQSFGKGAGQGKSRRREKMALDPHQSDTDSDLEMKIEVDTPQVELNEFAVMHKVKRKPKVEDPEFTRKRSYSKEDVKIGLTSELDTGAFSPEFIISDEEEYQIEDQDARKHSQ